MAIQTNRLSIDSIASLTKVDFNTKEEIVEETTTATSEDAESSSSLDKKPNVNTSPVDEAQGIHKAEANKKYDTTSNMSKGVKTKQANASNTRNFNNTSATSNDKHLEETKPINTTHDILSGSTDKKIDTVVNKSIGSLKLSKYGIKEDKVSKKVKAKLIAGIRGSSGFANMNKIYIDRILNDCSRDGVNYDGNNKHIAAITNAALIDELACGNMENALAMIKDITGGTPAGRAIMLKSIKNSLNQNNDSEVANKLFLVTVVAGGAETEEEKQLLKIESRGITGKVLKNLGVSKYKTNSTSSDNKNIKKGLDDLDPNWKKDENGNTNFHKVKDNKKMQDLAASDLANTHNVPDALGGPVETKISDSLGMRICATTPRSADVGF